MDKHLIDLFYKNLNSQTDLETLTADINAAKSIIYKSDDINSEIKNKISEKFQNDFLTIIPKYFQKDNPKQLTDILIQLEEDLDKIPKVHLEIAFNPKQRFLENVAAWFEKNKGTKVIVSYTLNEDLIAGVILEYQGKTADLSASSQILQTLTNTAV